jgi:adenosylhomocysteine nucleosidase
MVTSEVRTVLMVAAERFELKHIRAPEGQQWVLAANGPGPQLAGTAADRVGRPVDAVVSVGLCGGLVEQLSVGDIVVGTAVNGHPIDVPLARDRYLSGPIASIDHVAQTVAEKKALRETGAIAVEMEAAAVLERARRWGVPFYCVRVVSDVWNEGFTLDLNAARGQEGRFSVGRIVGQAIRRPVAGVPELLRLQRNAALAVRSLGEFLGSCSF